MEQMMNPNSENIWYVFGAAGDEAIAARIDALCKANSDYRTGYLEGREGPDVEESLPFPHEERDLEAIRIKELRGIFKIHSN